MFLGPTLLICRIYLFARSGSSTCSAEAAGQFMSGQPMLIWCTSRLITRAAEILTFKRCGCPRTILSQEQPTGTRAPGSVPGIRYVAVATESADLRQIVLRSAAVAINIFCDAATPVWRRRATNLKDGHSVFFCRLDLGGSISAHFSARSIFHSGSATR